MNTAVTTDSADLMFELEPLTAHALALCHHDRNKDVVAGVFGGESSPRGTRESSVSTAHGDADDDLPPHNTTLRFYFTRLPKTPALGFLFGRAAECDVFLQYSNPLDGREFVSRRQFCIGVDGGNGGLVLRTFKAARTMSVSFDGHGADQKRHGFQWVLFDWAGETILHLTAQIKFRLRLGENWAHHLARYLAETDQHRVNSIPSIYGLNLHSQQTTEGPSEALTPTQRPVYRTLSELGRGSFATVYAVLDVSTGLEHAQKIFHDSMPPERLRTEVDILRSTSHVRSSGHAILR
jgi:hypothetical protein